MCTQPTNHLSPRPRQAYVQQTKKVESQAAKHRQLKPQRSPSPPALLPPQHSQDTEDVVAYHAAKVKGECMCESECV
jgi:hypothetical protein